MPTFEDMQSPEIAELAEALSAAQGEFDVAIKDNTNPAFPKSKYADLAACINAARPHLAKHGLSVVQATIATEKDVLLRTILLHKSGQWIASYYPIVGDWQAPQKIGSAMTYARRYTLCALLQIAQDDDDAEAAMGRGPSTSYGQREDRKPTSNGRPPAPSRPAGSAADRLADSVPRQPAARPAPRPPVNRDDVPVDDSFGEPPPQYRR